MAYTKRRKDDWLKALYIHPKSLVLAHADNDTWGFRLQIQTPPPPSEVKKYVELYLHPAFTA